MNNIKSILGNEVAKHLVNINYDDISELRLRADKPLIIRSKNKIETTANYRPTPGDIRETIEKISQYSFYAFEHELSAGYITIPGGHRVGVCGRVVAEDGLVKGWRHISGLNIRVAHSVLGCADGVLPYIYKDDGIFHTMVISPPGFGKTTLLRDIIRRISDGGLTVGLADERSEVAGCFQGVPQNDVGVRTDVIDGCPKAVAMVMLLRAMSPDVIAVDELGGREDARAVDMVLNAGVSLLCTAHGRNLQDATENPALKPMLSRGIFNRFIILKSPGKIAGIYDGGGNNVA